MKWASRETHSFAGQQMIREASLNLQTSVSTFPPYTRRIEPSSMLINKPLFSISTRSSIHHFQFARFESVTRTFGSYGGILHSFIAEIKVVGFHSSATACFGIVQGYGATRSWLERIHRISCTTRSSFCPREARECWSALN